MKKLVNKHFIDYCFNMYPNLKNKLSYRYLFNYLCFGSFYDKDSGRLIISSKILSTFEKVECNHHYNSLMFLNDFKKNILNDFEWSKYNIKTQKPRMVINTGFDKEFLLMIKNEIEDFDKTNKIFFTTGESYMHHIKNKRKSISVKSINLYDEYNVYNESQNVIVNYMQNVDSAVFVKKISLNKENVIKEICTLDEESKTLQYKILSKCLEEPDIIYSHSKANRSCRLFAQGTTVLSLISNVRKTVCSGWTDLDLRSSQFCILSEILDAPISKEFIKNNGDIWKYFNYSAFGDNNKPNKYIKSIFKGILYGICFGKTVENLKFYANQNNITKLLDCDIIKELLQKRKIWFREIRKNGGVYDVWGNFIKLNKNVEDKKDYRWEGSVAACKIQSIELEIMRSLFDFANENDKSMQFKIVLFQHDGICCSFYNKSKKDRIIEKMKQVVRDKSKSMGYSIELTAEDL